MSRPVCLRTLAAVAAALVALQSARAFRLIDAAGNDVRPNTVPPFHHWDLREFPSCEIPYSIHVAGTADFDTENAEIDAAFQVWEDALPSVIGFVNRGGTATATIEEDGENVIFWDNDVCDGDAWDPMLRGGSVAVTATSWVDAPTGRIRESDIVFDDEHFQWNAGVEDFAYGDDEQVGATIREKAAPPRNEVCDTQAVCGDEEVIPPGGAAGAGAICVSPGTDLDIQSTAGLSGRMDVRTVAAHEIGHFLGLGENNAIGRGAEATESMNDGPFTFGPGATLTFTIVRSPDDPDVPVVVAFPAGVRTADEVVADINAAIAAQAPGLATAAATGTGSIVIQATDPDDDIVITGGTAAGTLGFVVGESGVSTMRQGDERRSGKSIDGRTLARDDIDGINFLYSPDLGDAPDPYTAAEKYPTKVHGTPTGATLNGVALTSTRPGAEHLFGFFGSASVPRYQYEWLGAAIDDSPFECEAGPVDFYDDGVTISGACDLLGDMVGDLTVTMRVRTSIDVEGNRHFYEQEVPPLAGPVFPMYLNGWFDWNDDGDWEDPGEHVIGTLADEYVVTKAGDYLFQITPPPLTPCDIWSRFRLDWKEDVGQKPKVDTSLDLSKGAAQLGEVEDYLGITDEGDVPGGRCYMHAALPISATFPLFQTEIGLERICHAPKPHAHHIPPFFPPQGSDGFQSTLTFRLDVNGDGSADEGIGMTGPVYIRRGAPFVDGDGLRTISTEMVAMSLHGVSPSLGPLEIHLAPGPLTLGRIKQSPAAQAAGVDVSPAYPADSYFDVFFQVSSPTLGESAVIGPARVTARITAVPPGEPDPDVDADGAPNDADNCLIRANPSQADCDADGIGDACEPGAVDCNANSIPDACDLTSGASVDCDYAPLDLTTRVSLSGAGAEGNAASLYPVSVSATGRHVLFASQAGNLVPSDANGAYDAFVRDRDTDGDGVLDEPGSVATILVSARPDGAAGNGPSNDPALATFLPSQQISADGRYVAFFSSATDLVAGDTNGVTDVFLRDRDADGDGIFDEPGALTTIRILAPGGIQANGTSRSPSISADGGYVAFVSFASNLVTPDVNVNAEVYVWQRATGTIRRVSVSSAGGQPSTGSSDNPGISADGRHVVYESTATSLVAGDTNGQRDIFRHDRDADADGIFDESGAISTARSSLTSTGAQAGGASDYPSISSDGRVVAFRNFGALVPSDTNAAADVYLVDLAAGPASLRRVSVADGGGQATGAGLDTRPGGVSPDGRYVVFYSNAANLVTGDTNATYDVFVHEVASVRTIRASLNGAGAQADNTSIQPVLSADNRSLVFVSNATNLVAGDANGQTDVFVRTFHDCNGNQTPDAFESSQALGACYGNGVPDECEDDCNVNAIADSCETRTGQAPDVNGNGIPDSCDCADGDGDTYPGPACPGAGPFDCDDQDPAVHPGAVELCDDRDNDCSGAGDDGCDDDLDDRCDGAITVVGTPAVCPLGGGDCDDTNNLVWARPTEARTLVFAADKRTLSWAAPLDLGGTAVVYDTLSSPAVADFVTAASCVESDGSDLLAVDAGNPASRAVINYLIRARNVCPGPPGNGSLGAGSSGVERAGRACP